MEDSLDGIDVNAISLAGNCTSSLGVKRRCVESSSQQDDDDQPMSAAKKPNTGVSTLQDQSNDTERSDKEVWKWWAEDDNNDGTKWRTLEHKGPWFAPAYEPVPSSVKFYYDKKEMQLSLETEEVAALYAQMLDHDYTTKAKFNENFFHDWLQVMTQSERATIKDMNKCDFTHMHQYFKQKSEERKAMSMEEKKAIKEKNDEIEREYGTCIVDGHKEKVGNFRIEPPGLFRGRGEHPMMGKLKKRVLPEDVIINCSKDSVHPQPPAGHQWKDVRHNSNVAWLAAWTENVRGRIKYVWLDSASKMKGEKDVQKFETARKLAKVVDKIRQTYREDWKSEDTKIRQLAVALYLIDQLALRAGNEKERDEADTVGCCSLRVEHVALHREKNGKDHVIVFDFLGKDSIRYYNEVGVEQPVFENLELFMKDKNPADKLFDRLNAAASNKHLNGLMEGLTAKVFRTFNASVTLQQQLARLTDREGSLNEKHDSYMKANRAVAILCNHQRAVSKNHEQSMQNLTAKIQAKRQAVSSAKPALVAAQLDAARGSVKEKVAFDRKKKQFNRLKEQLDKLEDRAKTREENKEISLGTSKLNYLDPRITVAWCTKHNVPIDKIYNATQRRKFGWAVDMADGDFVF